MLRAASFNQHNMYRQVSSEWTSEASGVSKHLDLVEDVFVALVYNFIRREWAPAQQAKIDRALDREIAFGSDFLPASHVRPNFDLNRRPGRSDAPPGSQGGANALLISLCPNIRLAP